MHAPPPLKWAGGKRWLVPTLLPLLPPEYGRYHEAFVGGGALYFGLGPSRASLNDLNRDLIDCYEALRDDCEKVISCLWQMRASHEDFLAARCKKPQNLFQRAAWVIYLTTLSFNGLYRVNRDGIFNVPYGHRPPKRGFDVERLRSAAAVLRNANLTSTDFAKSLEVCTRGDLVYLDPPYAGSKPGSFVRYEKSFFSWNDQKRLAGLARELAEQGCHVVVSNVDNEEARGLYTQFDALVVERLTRVAAAKSARGSTSELILASFELRAAGADLSIEAQVNGLLGERTLVHQAEIGSTGVRYLVPDPNQI